MNLDIIAHNWRCFGSKQISLPLSSFALIDSNGSGKTSILSAVYTLFTSKPWPGTKYVDFLKNSQQYSGLLTPYPDWSFGSQITKTGRLGTSTKRPRQNPLFSQDSSWPKIFTYLPSDNDWFSQSRTNKLRILDNLIGQIYDDYSATVRELEKHIKAKNKYIKYCQENEIRGDKVLVNQLSQNILDSSLPVWERRNGFMKKLSLSLGEFESWIESPISNWSVDYIITDMGGFRRKYDEVISDLKKSHDFEKLWAKELIIGKCFFGAGRDDFGINKSKSSVSQILSRGEMRLLVLFVKNTARKIVNEIDSEVVVWWLLDDVFNELDLEREKIFYEKVLAQTDYFVITGTKELHLPMQSFRVNDLIKEV